MPAGKRAKPTGLGDCDRKLGIHGAGHRRQQDRMIDFEQVEQIGGPATSDIDPSIEETSAYRVQHRQ